MQPLNTDTLLTLVKQLVEKLTMTNIADRYTRLCNAYIQLADKFQKLDVEHMSLRSKVVPALHALKSAKQMIEQLKQDKLALEAKLEVVSAEFAQDKQLLTDEFEQEKQLLTEKLQAITAQYAELKPLEALLDPGTQATLLEAEEQVALIDDTLKEMEGDRDPDLTVEDKQILEEYQTSPEAFTALPELTPIHAPTPIAEPATL